MRSSGNAHMGEVHSSALGLSAKIHFFELVESEMISAQRHGPICWGFPSVPMTSGMLAAGWTWTDKHGDAYYNGMLKWLQSLSSQILDLPKEKDYTKMWVLKIQVGEGTWGSVCCIYKCSVYSSLSWWHLMFKAMEGAICFLGGSQSTSSRDAEIVFKNLFTGFYV